MPGKSRILSAQSVREGRVRDAGRLMSGVENRDPRALEILDELADDMGKAHFIGITGAAGAGKSVLISALASMVRKKGKRVGIVAMDPSSPFTHGAFLGDRIRMQSLASDKDIFIRSMALRDGMEGVAAMAGGVMDVMDAMGLDTVILETAGAGQSDVDVMNLVQTVVVLVNPGTGDEIQALKAGIMEIGDIFVVSKADLPGAEQSAQDISSMLNMEHAVDGWNRPVLMTSTKQPESCGAVLDEIARHGRWLKDTGALKNRAMRRVKYEAVELVTTAFRTMAQDQIDSKRLFDSINTHGNAGKTVYGYTDRMIKRLRSTISFDFGD